MGFWKLINDAKSVGSWGGAPDPDGGAYSAPPYPLAATVPLPSLIIHYGHPPHSIPVSAPDAVTRGVSFVTPTPYSHKPLPPTDRRPRRVVQPNPEDDAKEDSSRRGQRLGPATTVRTFRISRGTPELHGILAFRAIVYGHAPRGPLDVLKETWEGKEKSSQSVMSHILTMRDRMEAMKELMMENMEKVQTIQKKWYDQNARYRELKVGSKMLVLSSTNKLLAQWQGPYGVLEQVGSVTYMIDMHDRRKQRKIFHVNMLREFCPPSDIIAVGYWC